MPQIMNRNVSAAANTADVAAGQVVNGFPELLDFGGNNYRIAGGRLTMDSAGGGNIDWYGTLARVVNSETALNHDVSFRPDLSVAGEWVGVAVRHQSHAGAPAPLRSMMYVLVGQPTNQVGSINLQWHYRAHDAYDDYTYTSTVNGIAWSPGGDGILLNAASLGGNSPILSRGIHVRVEMLGYNLSTFRITLYAASATEGDDTYGAQLWQFTATMGLGGDMSYDLPQLNTFGTAYTPGFITFFSGLSGNNTLGTISGPGRIISAKATVGAPSTPPLVANQSDFTQSSGQNVILPDVSGGDGSYVATIKVENNLQAQAGSLLDFDTTMAAVGSDSGAAGTLSIPHDFAPVVTTKHGGAVKYGKPRVYRTRVTSDGATENTEPLVVEDYYAPIALPPVAARFLTGSHLVVLIGDSRTQPNEVSTAVVAEYASHGVTATVINRGQASSWLTYMDPAAAQQGWLPNAPLFGVETDNLYNRAKPIVLAALAGGTYASCGIHIWLNLNDRRNGNSNPTIHKDAMRTLANALRADIGIASGVETHILIHDGGFGGDREPVAAFLKQDLILRDAMLDLDDLCLGETNGIWYGAQDITKGCRENPSYNNDGIAHQSGPGINFVADRMVAAARVTYLSAGGAIRRRVNGFNYINGIHRPGGRL